MTDSGGNLNDALLDRHGNCFGAIGDLQFTHNALEVIADGVFADGEGTSDLLVG
jgi:hypothetical protein